MQTADLPLRRAAGSTHQTVTHTRCGNRGESLCHSRSLAFIRGGPSEWSRLSPDISHSAWNANNPPRGGTRPTTLPDPSCRPGSLTRRSECEICGLSFLCTGATRRLPSAVSPWQASHLIHSDSSHASIFTGVSRAHLLWTCLSRSKTICYRAEATTL